MLGHVDYLADIILSDGSLVFQKASGRKEWNVYLNTYTPLVTISRSCSRRFT